MGELCAMVKLVTCMCQIITLYAWVWEKKPSLGKKTWFFLVNFGQKVWEKKPTRITFLLWQIRLNAWNHRKERYFLRLHACFWLDLHFGNLIMKSWKKSFPNTKQPKKCKIFWNLWFWNILLRMLQAHSNEQLGR